MKKIKLLVLSLGTATLLVACSSAGNTSANIPSETITAAAAEANTETTAETTVEVTETSTHVEPENNSLSVGQMAVVGDWEIILDSFEITDAIDNTFGSFVPADGNKYVVANITVKNTGTSADTFIGSYTFGSDDIKSKILYQGKYEYSGTNLLGHSDDLHNKSLNPLTSLTGILAFEIVDEAANSEELQLTFSLGKESVAYDLK